MNKQWFQLGRWTDKKTMWPLIYSAKGTKSPYPGGEKIPWKYSARGAKIQPKISHSDDIGNLPSKCLPQGKVFLRYKVKETHIPPFNKQESFLQRKALDLHWDVDPAIFSTTHTQPCIYHLCLFEKKKIVKEDPTLHASWELRRSEVQSLDLN